MRRALPVILLALGTLLVGSLGAVVWRSNTVASADPLAREKVVDELGLIEFRAGARKCAQEGENGWMCMNELVQASGPKMGVATVMAGLREAIEQYPEVYEQNCHRNTHYLGEYAGELFPNVPDALSAGGPDCQFGYYHGVIEGYARVTPTLWEEIAGLCDYLSDDRNSYIYQECNHSLGHAVVTRTDNDVEAGVERCRLLQNPPEQSACATGIFMSWSNTLDKMLANGEALEGKWAWADPDARYERCHEFDETMAGACVLFFAETVEHDPKGLGGFREWCTETFKDREHVLGQCHYGVGRVSGGYEEFFRMGEWKGIVRFCNDGFPYKYARMCAETAYGTASGFQMDESMITEACAAWEGHPKQREQCRIAREIFESTTADAGPVSSANDESRV